MNGHKNFFGNKYPSVQALSRHIPAKRMKKKNIASAYIPFALDWRDAWIKLDP